jgi:multiple sugar transport system permease protein
VATLETTPGRVAPSPQPAAQRLRRAVRMVGFYTGLAVLTVIFVAPLLWMLSTSLKTTTGATRLPLVWVPDPVSTVGYETILRPGSDTPVLRWFVNSVIAATAHAALVVAVAAPAAYALARMEFRLKKLMFPLIVATLFIPPIIFLTPNFLIVDRLGWIDTLLALIVPGAAGAFGVFFLRQFFLGIPSELEEAAIVDGANTWVVFSRVVLPLSKPALATLVLLSFLTNWNDFLWPVYVLFSRTMMTLPPGLATLQGAYTVNYPVIMAGAVIASVPVLVLFVLAQRFIIEGVSRTGLKG